MYKYKLKKEINEIKNKIRRNVIKRYNQGDLMDIKLFEQLDDSSKKFLGEIWYTQGLIGEILERVIILNNKMDSK